MKFGLIAAVLSLAWSAQAHAERLTFDHRLYPPLKVVLDSGRTEMTEFDDKNPRYLYNRIVIQGSSATDWTEAIEIVSRISAKDMRTAQDWFNEIRQQSSKSCPGKIEELARDDISITFSRYSRNCPKGQAQTALFRIIAGKRSLFLLKPIFKGEMNEAMRKQWLAMLQSAQLK